MRRVKRLWPAGLHGLVWGLYFGTYSWLITPAPGTARTQMLAALISGALFGMTMGVSTLLTRRRRFQVHGGDPLTRAERVTVINMVRDIEYSDDWRLRQVATRLAQQATRLSALLGPVVGIGFGVAMCAWFATIDNPRFWYLVAILLAVTPFAIWQIVRLRAAARAFLGP